MGQKPNIRIYAKGKNSGQFQDIFAMWTQPKGTSGQLDRDVEKIVLKNGTELTNDNCWFNLQDTGTADAHEPSPEPQNQEPGSSPF